jgi:hypothetical protein
MLCLKNARENQQVLNGIECDWWSVKMNDFKKKDVIEYY